MKVARNILVEHPSIAAAVLILARSLLEAAGRDSGPDINDILEISGSSRSQAYDVLGRLDDKLPSLLDRPGRKSATATSDGEDPAIVAITGQILDFLLTHPGAACCRGAHAAYSDDFRRFVVTLVGQAGIARELTVEQLAKATHLPLGTLKDWLRAPASSSVLASPGPTDLAEGDISSNQNVPDAPADLPADVQTASVPDDMRQDPLPVAVLAADTEMPPGFDDTTVTPSPRSESEQDSSPASNDPADPLAPFLRHGDIATIVSSWRNWEGDKLHAKSSKRHCSTSPSQTPNPALKSHSLPTPPRPS